MKTKSSIMVALLAVALCSTFFLMYCKKGNLHDELGMDGTDGSGKASATTAQSIMMGGMEDQIGEVVKGNQVWLFNQQEAAIADFGYNNCDASSTGPDNGSQCRH